MAVDTHDNARATRSKALAPSAYGRPSSWARNPVIFVRPAATLKRFFIPLGTNARDSTEGFASISSETDERQFERAVGTMK
jgi:hypothetical protein